MGSFILFLLLTLSANKTELESVMKAQEAASIIHEQSVQVKTLDKAEKVTVKKEQKEESKPSKKKINAKKQNKNEWMYFEITAYTNGKESTGKTKKSKLYGITASGKHTQQGRTVSADINLLPMGTVIYIDGIGERVVEDTGSAIKGHKLDLFIEDLKEAKQFGRKKNIKVKIIKMGVKK